LTQPAASSRRSVRPGSASKDPAGRPRLLKLGETAGPCLAAGAIGIALALAQVGLQTVVDGVLPDARRINSFNRPGTITILSADGQVVLKQGPVTREKLASGKMPALVRKAFVAAEDRRFYQHNGIDLMGIGRALLRNLSQGSVEEGASTITQQLARTVFLSQDRTLWRKIKEAALAGKIERQLSKSQILEQYLNVVYLGSSAYGVSDAAWVYFSKTPAQLTLAEAALIAGLPPAPSVYSPLVNPELALQRRAIVLRRMREAGFIDDVQLNRADSTPLVLKPATPKYFISRAPWFTSWLQQELPKVLSREQLEVGGLTIRTGLNLAWQELAQKTINTYSPEPMQGALVTIEPGTGLVRAMVGGHDFNKSQFNRATQALRSPGSTFKLFTYAAALQAGLKPEDRVSNSDQCYAGFCVKGTGGTRSIVEAVTRSLNGAAVATARKVGYPRVIAMARQLGIPGELGEYPSMVIGANEQYVIDMTAAYAAINNRGIYVKPTPFEEIYGPNGELLWSRRLDRKTSHRAVSSDIADAMLWMLEQAVRSGTGAAAGLADRPVSGKTGTSEGARDLWFIGSIPQITTGIWMGYDDNSKTGSSSSQAAVAWNAYMTPLVKGMPVLRFPPKPVLIGSFVPYKAPKRRDQRAIGPGGEHSPTTGPESWRPWNEDPEGNLDTGSRSEPSRGNAATWEPPAAESPRPAPPREEAPVYQPLPAASAPPVTPAPMPAPAAVAPPPISAPPPVSAPPPLP
jgi:penicillin-binding protein 1A